MRDERRWLVVGHGSVGSFVARRLHACGERVAVFDPDPRVVPVEADLVELSAVGNAIDYAVSCVPPEAAVEVPALLGGVLRGDGLLFDWNSVSPAAKRLVARELEARTVDVALLDTLDADQANPRLAVSGSASERAADLLRAQEFNVAIVGQEIGDAAALKFLRSLFMKALEALVLEYAALASVLDEGRVVQESVGANLGPQFVEFLDVLLRTDRVHASRRADELANVESTFRADGWTLQVPVAAIDVLRRVSNAWEDADAPPVGASAEDLAAYLGRKLCRSPLST